MMILNIETEIETQVYTTTKGSHTDRHTHTHTSTQIYIYAIIPDASHMHIIAYIHNQSFTRSLTLTHINVPRKKTRK